MTHSSDSNPLPEGTHIGRTALRVSDREAMVDFYRTVAGLEVLAEIETTSTLGVDETPLLVLEEDEDGRPRQGTEAGLYHNAFRVPSRGALGDALARIREHWQLDGASDHRVSEALYLSDPEGNGVEIYRDYPRDEWPRTDDGMVRMGTDPLDFAGVETEGKDASRVPPDTDVGHVHLEVTSLDAFRQFYVDALGFDVQATMPDASFVSAGGYHHHVGANTWHHRTRPANGRGLSWFEVVLPDRRALAEVTERLRNREIPVTEVSDGVAIEKTDDSVSISDPDNIEIRLRGGAPTL